MKVNPHKSSLGMDANTLALLLYIGAVVLSLIPFLKYFAWVLPLVFYFVEKQSPFVKFHAIQATCIYVIYAVLELICQIIIWISIASWTSLLLTGRYGGGYVFALALTWIFFVVIGIFAIIAMIKSYGYFEYKIPVIGNMADKWSKKGMTM